MAFFFAFRKQGNTSPTRAPIDIGSSIKVIRRVFVAHDGASRDLGAKAHPPPPLRERSRLGWCVENNCGHDNLNSAKRVVRKSREAITDVLLGTD